MRNSLPNGWVETSLEELQTQVIGGDWGKDLTEKTVDYVTSKVIRGTDFKKWQENRTRNAAVRKIKKSSLEKRQLKIGDIVVEVSGGGPDQPVGRTIIIDEKLFADEELPLVCSNFFRKVTLSKFANPFYVNYYLNHAYFEGAYNDIQTHTTNLRNLRVDEYLNSKVLLPPLAEQRRIVAKLDALFARVTNCKNRLEKIPALLKNFRQTVLAAAVSGELTKEWRKMNGFVQTGRELLSELVQFRRALEAATGGIKKQKMNFGDEEESYIPESWAWTRLLNLAEITGGVTKGRKLQNRETIHLPYLRVANVQDGYLDLSEIKKIEVLPTDLEKYKLVDGDILFTEGGDRDKLGRGTIWNNEIDNCIHQNHIFRARVFKGSVDPKYVSFFTKTKVAKDYFYENASQTVNLASINLTTLSNVPIALPPIEEQEEIVRKVEELFHFADSIEARYQKAKAWFDKLPQAILAKAFRGELVDQDENDEPATVLLERIKKEKQNTNKPKQPAKRKKVYEENEGVSLAAEE